MFSGDCRGGLFGYLGDGQDGAKQRNGAEQPLHADDGQRWDVHLGHEVVLRDALRRLRCLAGGDEDHAYAHLQRVHLRDPSSFSCAFSPLAGGLTTHSIRAAKGLNCVAVQVPCSPQKSTPHSSSYGFRFRPSQDAVGAGFEARTLETPLSPDSRLEAPTRPMPASAAAMPQ